MAGWGFPATLSYSVDKMRFVVIKKFIGKIAVKYLPDKVFALLLTTLWSRDTKIEKQREGWMISRGGLELLSPTPKCLFLRMDEWEERFEHFFKLRQGETAVDVGACYGDTAMPMLMKVGSAGKVIAIEPLPINIRFLRLNLQEFENCEIIEKAMWNEKGIVTFWLHEALTGGSIEEGYSRSREIRILADTIDNTLASIAVDFLKIDVEGSEIQVLEGAVETLRRVPKCVVGTHHHNYSTSTYPKVMEVLKTFGYEVNYYFPYVYAERKSVEKR